MRFPLRLGLIIGLLMLSPLTSEASSTCFSLTTDPPPHVDMARVRTNWLALNNRLRKRLKLQPYVLNDYLNETAMNWSAFAVKRGTIDHKRTPGSPYYDYPAIERWFADKGLEFANVQGKTFTENIGWGTYSCTSGDCTAKLIAAMRSTYNFFLAEKQTNGPHYRSLANNAFSEIGLGIAISPMQGRYYLTVHYGTKITNDPLAICND
ncbi:MAG: CAP domain-containing protein [Candidatus Peregrinibacteria bacterium]